MITGLLVPGTVAAYQKAGTSGFVSALSATGQAPPYSIDPRFPLFQQGLPIQKRTDDGNPVARKSHEELANVLSDAGLLHFGIDPNPGEYDDDARLANLAKAWVEFNSGYPKESKDSFQKYADRLDEEVSLEDATVPDPVLSLYFVARGRSDAWWQLSSRLYQHCQGLDDRVVRVVAAEEPDQLHDLMTDVADERVAIWVSGLEENELSAGRLAAYGQAIRDSASNGKALFALYGGFFSVLLGGVGLVGHAHGIGMSEHRYWRELPSSGSPAKRYYVNRLHRFVSVSTAQAMFNADRRTVACACDDCRDRNPTALSNLELMRHSVRARQSEIDVWSTREPGVSADVLDEDFRRMVEEVDRSPLSGALLGQTERSYSHLPQWISALRAIDRH